jgi:hypothetical protein
MFQRESEMARVEGGRAGNILHLVAHAVHGDDAMCARMLDVTRHC